MILHLFSILILVAAVLFCLNNTMSLANALMAVVVSFLVFPRSNRPEAACPPCALWEVPLTMPIKWTAFQKWMNMGKRLFPKSMTLPLNM